MMLLNSIEPTINNCDAQRYNGKNKEKNQFKENGRGKEKNKKNERGGEIREAKKDSCQLL